MAHRLARGLSLLSWGMAAASCALAVQPALLRGTAGVPASLLLALAAVTLMARYGGSATALPTAALATVMNGWFVLMWTGRGPVADLMSVLQVGAFLAVSASIIVFNDRRFRAQRELVDHTGFIEAMTRDPEEGICALDAEGHITSLNPAAERLLAGKATDLFGADLHALLHSSGVEGCDGQRKRCPFGSLIHPGTSVQTGEVDVDLPDSAYRRCMYTSSPILVGGHRRGTVLSLRDVTHQRTEVQSLREREEQYRKLMESSPDGIILTDIYGFITEVNPAAAELYGYGSPKDMVGLRHVQHVVPEDRGRYTDSASEALTSEIVARLECRGLKQDGTEFGGEIRMSPIVDDAGNAVALVQVCRDLSDLQQAEVTARALAAMVAVEQSVSLALSQSVTLGDAASGVIQTVCEQVGWKLGILWMVDAEDGFLRCHCVWHTPDFDPCGFDEFSRQLTLGRGLEVPGRVWLTGTPSWTSDVRADPDFSRALIASRAGLQTALSIPVTVDTGVRGVLEFLSRDAREESPELVSVMMGVAAQFAQFVERKDAEAALHYQARHDALTGLPNRLLLSERAERGIGVARSQQQPLALLLMDLDRFKQVNDSFGHPFGDALLQQVGLRLQEVLRESDTVARLGGDEFSVLLPNADPTEAGRIAELILAALCQPFVLDGQSVDTACSIGISLFPDHGDTLNTLLQHADVAMYAAKRSRAGYVVYAAEQDENSPDRLILMADLRDAIEQGRITVHYQPQIDFRTGRVESVEALARWHHPEHGLIMPDQLIPLAEQCSQIKPLSYCVLNQALRQCRMWREVGLALDLTVNVSADNLYDLHLVDTVYQMLEIHGVDGSRLVLEITEAALMVDPARATETILQLREIGVRTALDDFGTGYSALTHLNRLPIDQIKIDKSFVIDMAEDDNGEFVARAVIELGHNLGLDVVAEGVATGEIAQRVAAMGCDYGQGSHLSEPLPASELTAWLEQRVGTPMRARRVRKAGA